MSWLSESLKTIKALRTPENAPILAEFQDILLEDIPPASALIFYGTPGNELTERLGVNLYGCKFHPPFHAALMMRDGIFHDVGKFRTDHPLEDEKRSTRRIDVIIYKMTETQRSLIMRNTELDTSIPHTGLEVTDYGIGTFLHFGFPFINHSKKPVCSENDVRLLSSGSVTCADKSPEEVAPWDLVEWAENNQGVCELRTFWVGKDFHR